MSGPSSALLRRGVIVCWHFRPRRTPRRVPRINLVSGKPAASPWVARKTHALRELLAGFPSLDRRARDVEHSANVRDRVVSIHQLPLLCAELQLKAPGYALGDETLRHLSRCGKESGEMSVPFGDGVAAFGGILMLLVNANDSVEASGNVV